MQAVILRIIATLAIAVGIGVIGCARSVRIVQLTPQQPAVIGELWQEPTNASTRDLFHGPGGPELLPRQTEFTFVADDVSGYSPGFDVEDDRKIEWSVKTGAEAQTEVVVSRILWALGFHQPPTYYIENWSLKGARTGPQQPGRFRPDLPGREVVGDWPWHENPFVRSREFGGLIVANLVLTNWDWKTSNNKIYQLQEPINGVSRWFVVRDIGGSLGQFKYPTILKWFRLRGFGQGSRNDLPGFEQQGFIESIDTDRGRVDFDYRGIYRDVVGTATAADVRWACERLSRLTETQWLDAFRAGAYTPEQTKRYVDKIKQKVAQGLQLTAAD